jgi:hypothetical protein
MFMWYRGGGVGHKSIQKAIQKFCDDRWPEELKMEMDNSLVQLEDDGEEDIGAEDLSSSDALILTVLNFLKEKPNQKKRKGLKTRVTRLTLTTMDMETFEILICITTYYNVL